jgi:hypothetical protein
MLAVQANSSAVGGAPNWARSAKAAAAMASSAAAQQADAPPAAPAPAKDEKLNRMREAMAKADGGKGVHAFIVPSEDPHMVGYRSRELERKITLCVEARQTGPHQ